MTALDDLPAASTKRVAVRVTPSALRHIRAGHPWVFDGSIVSISHDGAAGDLAVVFDASRRFVAIGLYDPSSPIRVRILHHGDPATIDREWWRRRLASAIDRRRDVAAGASTTGYRVVNGENDGFPGLVLDRYSTTFVLKLYTAAWCAHLADLVTAIEGALAPEALIVRFSREVHADQRHGLGEGTALIGSVPHEPVLFREHGLTFEADVVHGQKTGHFLDQRENRQRVRALSKGARVLDVFACTGGFSVYAAAGGAAAVHSVDLSNQALATARRNMAHNASTRAVQLCEHTTEAGDAFKTMTALAADRRRFDIVVIDPPSFARKQSDRDRALHAYRRLTRLGLDLIDDGGVLVQSSCSSRVGADEFFDAIHAGVAPPHAIREMTRTGHAADHPVTFPEGAYLKTLFARVSRNGRGGR